ncbi:MAG: FN3 associated domain-containing protein [Eubacteriales bacterium]|jgi:tetratricopeptide (TPR) repeat protein
MKKSNLDSEKNEEKHSRHPFRTFLKICAAVLLTGAMALGLFRLMSMGSGHDYFYQKNAAESAFRSGRYETALSYADAAEKLRGSSADLAVLRARILSAMGESSKAVSMLNEIIGDTPGFTDAYRALADIYISENEAQKAADVILSASDPALVSEYSDYVCSAPSFNLKDGQTYTYSTKLKITADQGATIYYTTDGTDPDQNSQTYSSPIVLPSGTVTVKAIAVNKKGVESDITEAGYTIQVR